MREVQVSASEPIAASAFDPMPSVSSAPTTTVEIDQATGASVSVQLWPSYRSIGIITHFVDQTAPPVARREENRNQSPSSRDVIAQVEQNHSVSHLQPCILSAFADDQ